MFLQWYRRIMSNLIKRNGLLPNRTDLFDPFEQLFNKFYDEMFSGLSTDSAKGRAGYPKIDVIKDNGKFIVEAAIPGVKAENVTVEVMPLIHNAGDRFLKIAGKMEENTHSEKANWHIKELRRSSFERYVAIPDYVKGEPEAVLKDGILKLSWEIQEKKEPERKLIPIKSE